MADITLEIQAQGIDEAAAAMQRLNAVLTGSTQAQQNSVAVTQRVTQARRRQLPTLEQTIRGYRRLQFSETASARSASVLRTENDRLTAGMRGGLLPALQRMNAQKLRNAATSRRLGMNYGMVVNEISEFTFALSTAIPSLRTMGSTMAMAGNSAMGMGMKMGPIGVALGVLMGAIPAFIGMLSDTSSQMDAVGASARNTTRDILQLVSAMRQQALVSAAEARVAAGLGTVEEQRAELERARRGYAMIEPGQEPGGLEGRRAQLAAVIAEQLGDGGIQGQVTARVLQRVGEIRPGTRGAADRIARIREEFAPGGGRMGMTAEQASAIRVQFDRVAAAMDRVATAQENIGRAQVRERESTRLENLAARAAERRTRTRRRGGGGGRRRDPERDAQRAAQQNARELREFARSMAPGVDQLLREEEQRERTEFELAVSTRNKRVARERMRDQQRQQREAARESMRQARDYSRDIDRAATEFADSWREGVNSVIGDFDRFNEALTNAGITALDQSVAMRQVVRATWNDVLQSTASGAGAAMESALEATISGEQGFADAIKQQSKAFIQGVVARSTVGAIEQGALALADLAIGNPTGAALHGAAAAQYAAVAGVAASVGYATGTIGKAAKEPEKEAKKERTPKPDETRQGAGTVVINVGTFPVSTEADVGRAVRDALRASERRDGRR